MRRTNLPTHQPMIVAEIEEEREQAVKVRLIAMKDRNEHCVAMSFGTGYGIAIVSRGVVVAVETGGG